MQYVINGSNREALCMYIYIYEMMGGFRLELEYFICVYQGELLYQSELYWSLLPAMKCLCFNEIMIWSFSYRCLLDIQLRKAFSDSLQTLRSTDYDSGM